MPGVLGRVPPPHSHTLPPHRPNTDFLDTPPSLSKFFANALQPTPEMNQVLPRPLAKYPGDLPAIIDEKVRACVCAYGLSIAIARVCAVRAVGGDRARPLD